MAGSVNHVSGEGIIVEIDRSTERQAGFIRVYCEEEDGKVVGWMVFVDAIHYAETGPDWAVWRD